MRPPIGGMETRIEAVKKTHQDGLHKMTFRPNRRQIISGMASLGVLTAGGVGPAVAQKRVIVPEGEFQPMPIAIPNFVAGTPSDGDVGAGWHPATPKNLNCRGF